MPEIKVKCPAKINLTLEILNKREDGFHNIQSVMQTINLFDILTIKVEKSENFEIKLSGTSDEIPYDEKNLVHKATLLFLNAITSPSPLVGEGWGEGVQGLPNKIHPINLRTNNWTPDDEFKKLILSRAKELRQESTPPEDILWYFLRAKRFVGLKFKRQVPIKKYIADFICFEKRLIIELDGSGHLKEDKIAYDKKRDEFLRSQNFKVLRFYNDEISNNIEGVLESIYFHTLIEPPLPTLSRKGRGDSSQNPSSPITISIHIEKNIPIAAGLAGGSTDAAGTLWGLNKLFDEPLSKKELHELCAQLGSDLNFCLEGGCQLTTGRGEILTQLPFQEFNLSLVKPKTIGISAKEAYTKFSKLKTKPNLDMTTKLVTALNAGEADIDEFLHNDLELAVINDYKELEEIKIEYPESIMSGSGSTFFAINIDFKDFDDTFWIKNGLKSIPYGVCEAI